MLFSPGGPRARAGRPGRATPVPRRAPGAARAAVRRGPRRLREGAASSATPCSRRPGKRRTGREDPYALSTLEVWDDHLAVARRGAAGRAPEPRRRPRAAVAASAYMGVAPDSRPAKISYRPSLGETLPETYGVPDGERAQPEVLKDVLLKALGEAREAPSSSAASAWSARTGTSWSWSWARHRPRATRATASRGRSRWRCGSAATSCCARRRASRCCCSTTCSPSWTASAGARLAEVAASAEQVLVTAAVDEDVPGELAGARFVVADGEITRG